MTSDSRFAKLLLLAAGLFINPLRQLFSRYLYCLRTDGEFNSILAPSVCPLSFNYFIRTRQHVRRNRQADLFGRLQIDHEFKLRRLLYRKVCGLSAF